VFSTKDSGKRIEFETGMHRDVNEGKPRYDLIRPKEGNGMLERWAMLMARGAQKYGDRNWEKASTQEEYNRFVESACRHFEQWVNGETDEDHAAATFFNIQGAEYTKQRMKSTKPKCGHLPAKFPYICMRCLDLVEAE
jgi:hypothetical protein